MTLILYFSLPWLSHHHSCFPIHSFIHSSFPVTSTLPSPGQVLYNYVHLSLSCCISGRPASQWGQLSRPPFVTSLLPLELIQSFQKYLLSPYHRHSPSRSPTSPSPSISGLCAPHTVNQHTNTNLAATNHCPGTVCSPIFLSLFSARFSHSGFQCVYHLFCIFL